MTQTRWRMGFHLMPPVGWLNDPNGLCQLNGTYHVFHQYSPDWPTPDAARGWGHFASEDLVHWRSGGRGFAIAPDTADETSGSYSGCAVVVPEGVRLYYTGNVKEPGDYDYVHAGRRSSQILVESPDGVSMGEKRVLLRNADYPDFCTRHVRDPKVWRDADGWWMLLGARDLDDRGLVLRLRSDDGIAWEEAGCVRASGSLGYMWECPDRIALAGREWLSVCPQGVGGEPWATGASDVAAYLPLPVGARLGTPGDLELDPSTACLWDHGFDFYAPQSFVDESGRTLLLAWMGSPSASWESAPEGLSWCHCLTVPREVTAGPTGALLQAPARELEALRGRRGELAGAGTLALPRHRADVTLRATGPFELALDGALSIACEGRHVRLSFSDDAVGCGRGERSALCSEDVRELRVLVDDSAVEVFANGGEAVFVTRWFPRADELALSLAGDASADVWEMGDGMSDTYAQPRARPMCYIV